MKFFFCVKNTHIVFKYILNTEKILSKISSVYYLRPKGKKRQEKKN